MPGPGTVLDGRYRLVRLLGGGAMGQVWRAYDLTLERDVALKLLRSELLTEPQALGRFEREAKMLGGLRHPNIVAVYDSGYCDAGDGEQRAYLVMEYVEGRSLRDVLNEERALDPDRVLGLVADIAEALEAAHAQGVVHRDVKPANVLIRADGRAVLADFGVARSAAMSGITRTGVVVGTFAYLAPEQAKGGELGPAADLYSLGVVAYECLAGHRPFQGEAAAELIYQHLHEEPPPLPPQISDRAREVVFRALRKEPADRWPSAAELAAVARGTNDITPSSEVVVTIASPPVDEPARRRPGFVLPLTAALAVILLTGGTYVVWLAPWDSGTSKPKAAGAAPAGDLVPGDAATPIPPRPSPSPTTAASASRKAPAKPKSTTPSPTRPAPATTSGGGGSKTTAPATTKSLTVPDVVGQFRSTAKQQLAAAGFAVSVQMTTGWYIGAGTCQVTRQNPQAGARLKKGGTVTIWATAFVTSTNGSCD